MHVEHGLKLFVGHLLDRRVPGVAGVVDDDIESAERLHRGGDEAIGKASLGDAAVDRDGFAAGGLDFGGDRIAWRRVEIVDHDLGAFAGEFQRDGAADATPDPVMSATLPVSFGICFSP